MIRRDQILVTGLVPASDAGDPALVQDHHPVGDLQRVQDIVGDDDHRHAALLDLLDQLQAAPGLGDAQCRERLVQQDQPAAPMDKPSELDRLALPARERVDPGAQGRKARAQVMQRLAGLFLHRPLAQPAQAGDPAHQLTAHEEIGDHVDVGAQGQVLIDRLDAGGLGVGRTGEGDLPALHTSARCSAAARRQ